MNRQTVLRQGVVVVVTYVVAGVVMWAAGARAETGLEGHWAGAFGRLGSIQAVEFDFRRGDSGWSATYSIPDMILYREPARELAVSGDTVRVRVFWGRFVCLLHDEVGEITGENTNWKPSVSLHLKRQAAVPAVRIEPVRFRSGAVTLAGDVLLPDREPPYPAVVIIEGSTTEGRALWTYRSIGELYARNGIAALIYDKRGCGESGGDFAGATFADLASDAERAVGYLAARADIDAGSVGVFGISQGGWLAPLVASRSPQVSYVVMLAGPAVSIWQQELDRVAYSMRAGVLGENDPDVFDAGQIEAALAHTRLGFEVAEHPERWPEWERSVAAARSGPWAKYVALDSTVMELQGWLRYRYDPSETLKLLRVPVLALFGETDVMVPPAENVELLRRYLRDAGNQASQVVVFPGVGHDFLTGASLVGEEWNWPSGFWRWNRRAPGLADTIVAWSQRQRR